MKKPPRVFPAREQFRSLAVGCAAAGGLYLVIGVAAGWRWAWTPLSYFWVAPVLFFPIECWRYASRKRPPPSGAVVETRGLRWPAVSMLVIGGVIIVTSAFAHRFVVAGALGLLGYAVASALMIRHLDALARSGRILVARSFWLGWDSGIYERQTEGWYKDPSRRHQCRFWDGSGWTAWVSDDDVVSEDASVPSARWV